MSNIFSQYLKLDFQGDSLIDKSGVQTVTLTNANSMPLGVKAGIGKGCAYKSLTTAQDLRIPYASTVGLNMGTSDFILEMWIKAGLSSGQTCMAMDASGGWKVYVLGDGQLRLTCLANGGGATFSNTQTTVSTWKDFSQVLFIVDRSGFEYVYVDGIQTTTAVDISASVADNINTSTGDFNIGGTSAAGTSGNPGLLMNRVRIYNFGVNGLNTTKIPSFVQQTAQEFFQVKQAGNISRTVSGFVTTDSPDARSEVETSLGSDIMIGAKDFTVWTQSNVTSVTTTGFTATASTGYVSAARLTGGIGQRYNLKIAGTVSAGTLRFYSGNSPDYVDVTGTFSTSVNITVKDSSVLYIQVDTNGAVVNITTLEIKQLQGLLGAWNMNPNNGIVTDISGNGFNGIVTGAVVSKGVMGNALQFNNSGGSPGTGISYINILSTSGLNPTNALTFFIRCKIFSNPSTSGQIIAKGVSGTATANVFNYAFELTSTGTIQFRVSDNTNSRLYSSTSAIPLNQWLDINVTWDGASDTFVYYINAVTFPGSKTGTAISSLSTTSRIINIGYDAISGRWGINGLIDTVKLYNIVKTTAQISEDYLKVARLIEVEERFTDEGADVISKRPSNWQINSGTFIIGEYGKITNGNFMSGYNFSTGVPGTWTPTRATIDNATQFTVTSGSNGRIGTAGLTVVGRRYRMTIAGTCSTILTVFDNGLNDVYKSSITGTFNTTFEFSVKNTGIAFVAYFPGVTNITTLTLVEIPPFPDWTETTKYLRCLTAGTTATLQGSGYGTWDFDWFKSADASTVTIGIAADRIGTFSAFNGYMFQADTNESLYVAKNTIGSNTSVMNTAASYIGLNTWYRVRITRSILGVFTTYIKGGSFGTNNWTPISVTGGAGSNPGIENTYSASTYFTFSTSAAGDRIANIIKYFSVVPN